ncbi:ATP-dependent helicase [Paenibacillus pini]|uniref:DNA 3'-5' helicase n=1 Tax=Paenibacillus pini JCM 16418 TaxID=1236976 RepID=W7YEY7_9BACL|nr:ATP-dependent helicase [Paenibacillus pini]GAF09520.1 ATP-dependent DNA helicase UvrD/PcrA [Paenibacillus pini JCM 16418]
MGFPDLPLHSNPAKTPATSVPPMAASAPAWTSRERVTDVMDDAFFFRALEENGILLNAEQIEAVRHHEGPLLIVAGAGSGKTTVLAARTAYLIAVLGIPATRILLVTFTSKAAQEIKERIAKIPGIPAGAARSVEARTFHSFGLMLLRKSGFTQRILGDFAPRHTIMKIVLRKLDPSGVYQPETVLAALSSWKMKGYWPSQLPDDTKDEAAMKRIMMAYEEWKLERNQWDFDDILLNTLKLLEDPRLLAQLQSRYAYIMVDEFQDTNAVQYSLVQHLAASSTRNIAVVGDDDQTIYTFNGARQESILEFDQVYPTAKRVTLHINYRSDHRILGLGSALVRHNKLRLPKELLASAPSGAAPVYLSPASVDEEAQWVVGHLIEDAKREQIKYGDIAILHRTAGSSRAILEQLLLHGVPFVQYGSAPVFYDQALIRPLMDHLRLSLIPRRMEHYKVSSDHYMCPKSKVWLLLQNRNSDKRRSIHSFTSFAGIGCSRFSKKP